MAGGDLVPALLVCTVGDGAAEVRARWRSLVAALALAMLLPMRLRWTEAHPFARTLSRLLTVQVGSGRMRVDQYHLGLATLWQRHRLLTGFGAGHWRAAMSRHPLLALNDVPHSDLLRVAFDGGLVGLALFGAGSWWALRLAWRSRGQGLAPVVSLVALALVGLGDVPLARAEGLAFATAVVAFVVLRGEAGVATCERTPPTSR